MEIVVLTGAGVSAESGLKTFRDNDGLWEAYNVYDIATPEAWVKNPALVTKFYNMRRKQLYTSNPNRAHELIAKLEKKHHVKVITQNIDDFHERAGSTEVLHLHGELNKVRSSVDEHLLYDCPNWEVKMGDTCEKGSQLRPHVVWFGEAVPKMLEAEQMIATAELVLIIGTSLKVYPAAGLAYQTNPEVPIILIDPVEVNHQLKQVRHILQTASKGMELIYNELT